MTYRRLGIPIVALAATIFAASVVLAPAAGASSGSAGVNRVITPSGSTSYSPSADGDGSGLTQELGPGFAQQADGFFSNGNHTGVNRSRSIEHNAPSVPLAPIAPGVGVSSSGLTVLNTFDALNHRQQRRANGGNQFSLEPPDQGLCANNGVVVETINDVMRVYSANGTPLQGVEDLNTFLGYHAQFNRTTGEIGQFVTDPACFFDPTVNRWFLDALTIEVFPFNDPKNHISAGDFTGQNHIDLAVSDTSSPLGTWTIYRFQVQDDGNNGTPDHGCKGIAPFGQSTIPTFPNACIGDYPHIGADANAIYIDTNEYSFFGNDFHGAQIYAFAKAALVAGTSVNVTQFDTHGMDNGNSGFTIWPATAPAGLNSTDNGGTEFFLSSNAADEAHGNGASVGPRQSNQLLVWKVTQSSTIDSATPALVLSHSTLSVGLYVVPARSEQKVGDTPLADCLSLKSCATNFALGIRDPFAPEHESPLDSNDSRMQQVVFADGKLWGALDTSVNSSANTRAGIEWFVVDPSGNGSVVNQGYLAVSQNNLTYPAIAVRPDGKGVMAFTLVGRDFYPSAAFASIDASGTGNVQIAAAGAGPSDGFSGTAVFNAPNPARPRWGDYGAAVVDGTNIFIASEYINQTCNLSEYVATGASCGGTRTLLANWGTRISEVSPG
jgi:hypothetical protein